METKLDYELWIKGRKADIGSELWFDYGGINKVAIDKISIFNFQSPQIRIKSEKGKYTFFRIDNLEFIEACLFWEKPITYQLPDTEGNLSEVKIGQTAWTIRDNGVVEEYEISRCKDNCIGLINKRTERFDSVITGIGKLLLTDGLVTTNKPSRFHGKQDWSQPPLEYGYWSIDKNGRAGWYNTKPKINKDVNCFSSTRWQPAGFRQDLINPETGFVDDWQDSLVKRPSNV